MVYNIAFENSRQTEDKFLKLFVCAKASNDDCQQPQVDQDCQGQRGILEKVNGPKTAKPFDSTQDPKME